MSQAVYRDDEEDRKKSLMYKQKTLCNGEATGYQCKHYWYMVLPIDVHNSTVLRHGEKSRLCTVIDTADGMRLQGESGPELPVICNRYEPCGRKFDAAFEEFNPLTEEELDAIEAGLGVPDTLEQPKIGPLKRLLLRILP